MDLLHSRRFEGFCLVSSDSDFTRLATRIREDGLVVYGFGEKKAPKSFVNACDRYTYVENLIVASPPAHIVESLTSLVTEELMPQPDSLETPLTNKTAQVEKELSKPVVAAEVVKTINRPPLQASNLLLRAYTNVTDDHGWAMIGSMSSYIHANHSDFDPRSFGCAKFIDLIQKTNAFELIQRAHKNGQSYFCRPKRSGREHTGTHEYLTALLKAVAEARAPNGWAPISIIGQKLRALGHDISKSGFSTLTEALEATSLFEMQGSGAARYFRAKI